MEQQEKNQTIDMSYWAAFGELRSMAERPEILEPEVEFWDDYPNSIHIEELTLDDTLLTI